MDSLAPVEIDFEVLNEHTPFPNKCRIAFTLRCRPDTAIYSKLDRFWIEQSTDPYGSSRFWVGVRLVESGSQSRLKATVTTQLTYEQMLEKLQGHPDLVPGTLRSIPRRRS